MEGDESFIESGEMHPRIIVFKSATADREDLCGQSSDSEGLVNYLKPTQPDEPKIITPNHMFLR